MREPTKAVSAIERGDDSGGGSGGGNKPKLRLGADGAAGATRSSPAAVATAACGMSGMSDVCEAALRASLALARTHAWHVAYEHCTRNTSSSA